MAKLIAVLIITGQHGHDWKASTKYFEEFLPKSGMIQVSVTTDPAKDLNPAFLKKFDVLLWNYRNTDPKYRWGDPADSALLGAVRGGKGLVVYHHASSAFLEWLEFDRMIAGGWRGQGFHGPRHVFQVTNRRADHPIMRGMPRSFMHENDELYQNSVMYPENVVLATAYSDPNKPEGTGLDEPVIWVKRYGRGRVFVNALGHDTAAMKGVAFQTLMIRGIEWAATGKVTYPVPSELLSERGTLEK